VIKSAKMTNVSVILTYNVQLVKNVLITLAKVDVNMMRTVQMQKLALKDCAKDVNQMMIAQAAKNAKIQNVFVRPIRIVLEVKSV
jgi:hypothetical protein